MEYALEVENLVKPYPRFRLDGISLALPQGRGMELLGENGSGKTAFIKAVLGLTDAKARRIEILGRPPALAAELVGAVLKGTRLPGQFTVKDLAYINSKAYKRFDMAFLKGALERLSIGLEARLGSLSPAERTLALVCLALAHHPALLVLDEAPKGLSSGAVPVLEDILRGPMEEGSLSLLCAGRSPVALGGLCGMVALLHDGRLVLFGSKEEIFSKYRILDLDEKESASVNKRKLIGPRRLKDGTTRALVEAKDFKGSRRALRRPELAEVVFHFAKREESRR